MTGSQLTFSRRIDRPLASSLEAIVSWRPSGTAFTAGRPIVDVPGGARPFRLVLRMRRMGRSLPMELSLSAWSGGSSHLELAPLRAVRPGRRYFACARALLADASSALDVEAAPENGLRRSA